jgi:hypothetical protein
VSAPLPLPAALGRPLDVPTMRTTASLFLSPNSRPPAPQELETLILRLRGHLQASIPEVEAIAERLPEGDTHDILRYCALACVGEARLRLSTKAARREDGPVDHARNLARSVNALCDHYEYLGADR